MPVRKTKVKVPGASAFVGPVPVVDLAAVCEKLQSLQRLRRRLMMRRVALGNSLVATVADLLGYHADLDPGERKVLFDKAQALIKEVVAGRPTPEIETMRLVVLNASTAIASFEHFEGAHLAEMTKMAAQLPAAAWVGRPEQRGFGLGSLATVVGEAGDLNNYAGPYKLYKRMAVAPHEFGGHTHMGSTWAKGAGGLKLPPEEWVKFGYNRQRRSIMWNIGECLIKGNKLGPKGEDGTAAPPGPYRAKYLQSKEDFKQKHEGCSDGHAHNHGRLLASKLLLKNLWVCWVRGEGEVGKPHIGKPPEPPPADNVGPTPAGKPGRKPRVAAQS